MSNNYNLFLIVLFFTILPLKSFLNLKKENFDKTPRNQTLINYKVKQKSSISPEITPYEKYCNSRFEFCIEYPASLKPQGESDNGDGQTFKSEDGLVTLSVWGNLMILTMKEELDIALEDKQITYKAVKPDWFVISGYTKDGNIFYRKTKTNKENGSFISFLIEYPVSQKDTYNKVCEKISNSFK